MNRLNKDYAKLLRYARSSMGWHVHTRVEFGEAEAKTLGAIHKRSRTIMLAWHIKGRKRLFTLLHECGHALSYRIGTNSSRWVAVMIGRNGQLCYGKNRRAERHNETQAYLLGTALASHLGLGIDRRAWREFNWQADTR